ncbi:GNAT family N-acetyltransferase [Tenacibaculum xiamenense]|uniref:GNAT family N-acetyltransferase n=1 Tax=Tenacibaculum xiamenense TaxID=1261553 RepID=UPI0038957840
MYQEITNNLFEFWKHIGDLTQNLSERSDYSFVSSQNSDFPNRIFNLREHDALASIFENEKIEDLPNKITVEKPNSLKNNSNVAFAMSQKNMALDMSLYHETSFKENKIKRVNSEQDAIDFAKTASDSFGYNVNGDIIFTLAKKSTKTQLFLFQDNEKSLGCGIVFIDSQNNAGLHMIGTLPEGRGQGVGSNITKKLLSVAKNHNAKHTVLNASAMGEPIYKKLGFQTFGEIETYQLIHS